MKHERFSRAGQPPGQREALPVGCLADLDTSVLDTATGNPMQCRTKQRAGQRPNQHDCGPLPFLIQRDGTWLYRGSAIRRKPMVCLFASVLRRDADGRYRLETPVERGEIEVEDVPFVAVELEWRGCGREQVLAFRTNVDEIVCAGPDNPLVVDWSCACGGDAGAAIPYLTVRPGDGDAPIQARVARAVYYELAALAVPGQRDGVPCMGVWSQNRFFPIGPMVTTAWDEEPDDEDGPDDSA